MKKLTLLVAFAMVQLIAFSGGLLTNYNQSAQYIRMLARNASYDIDAVFYNPAGLAKMNDGWHFAFSGQTILQTREISSGFPFLNQPAYYEGEATIPIYPNIYGVYKKDKWAFSLGVGPVGGGGTINFDNGLPSLEIPYSRAVPKLAESGVTGYSLDMAIDATSVYWGIQLGATYTINDNISVYGGARLVPASNKYEGYIRNVEFEVSGQKVPASDFLYGAANQASTGATLAYGAEQSMQPIMDNNGAGFTLNQLEEYGYIDATTKQQIAGGLVLFGVPAEQIPFMTAEQIQGAYGVAGDQLTGVAEQLNDNASEMEDKQVDVKQKGFGITPIIGVNIDLNDWNIGFKYEHKTKITLTNETIVDDLGLFPPDEETVGDLPGIFTAGIGYRGLDWLEAQISYNLYLDKGVDWGYNVRYPEERIKREIESNSAEYSLGLQFNLSEKFAISVGGLILDSGVAESYQSDFSFSNSAKAISGGIMWKITDKLTLDAGISNINYEEDEVGFTDPDVGVDYTDTYLKKTMNIAAGITYSIF